MLPVMFRLMPEHIKAISASCTMHGNQSETWTNQCKTLVKISYALFTDLQIPLLLLPN